jgi:hypothetical protein
MLAKEHAGGNLDAAIFYMDIRTNGKDFERYYNRAKDEAGVRFVKSRVTNIVPDKETGMNLIRYVDEQGLNVQEAFDMVVLSVGLGATAEGRALAEKMGLKLNHYNFVDTASFKPVETGTPGIFVCGACQGPKDIPSSVVDSSAAAGWPEVFFRMPAGPRPRRPSIPGGTEYQRGSGAHRRVSFAAAAPTSRAWWMSRRWWSSPKGFPAWSSRNRTCSAVPRTPRTR